MAVSTSFPAVASMPLYGALLIAIYAVYAHLFLSHPDFSRLPWAHPKRPFLLHEALIPQLLLTAALYLPTPPKFNAAVFFPLIIASCWTLLGSGAESSAAAYAVGTAAAFFAYKSAELLLFCNVRELKRYTRCDAASDGECWPHDPWRRLGWVFELTTSLRGVGWSWCVALPRSSPPTLPYLAVKGALVYALFDILILWMRSIDKDWFIPEGHGTGFTPPANGIPYPHIWAPSNQSAEVPVPSGFPAMPESWLGSAVYKLMLLAIRSALGASGIFAAIAGLYTFFSLVFIALGTVLGTAPGWRGRWLSPTAWPEPFGGFGTIRGGIRGWWGRTWHGLFRSVFMAPTQWAVDTRGLQKRGVPATLLAVTVPFVLSGGLHFAGSWTQSSAGLGAARFFFLQPAVICAEALAAKAYRRHLRPTNPAAWVQWVENAVSLAWTATWLLATGSSLFEEYRWGGLWGTEPVPVSFLRMAKGERWNVWTPVEGERPWWRWAREGEGGWLGENAVVIC